MFIDHWKNIQVFRDLTEKGEWLLDAKKICFPKSNFWQSKLSTWQGRDDEAAVNTGAGAFWQQ